MYTKIKVHNDLIKEIQKSGSEIGLSDLTSQVAYLIRLGIEKEKECKAKDGAIPEHTCPKPSHALNQ